jgi:hypothetical protein
MKWLFVALLVLNTAYFAWEFNRQLSNNRGPRANVQTLSRPVERLRLLSEVDRFSQVRRSIQPPLTNKERLGHAPFATNGETSHTLAVTSNNDRGLTNLTPAQEMTTAIAPTAEDHDEQGELCFALGPLPAEQEAIEVQNWLHGLNAPAEQRIEERPIATRYWIILDTQGSTATAQEHLADLERKGVEDFQLTRDRNGPNVISLGLYSTRTSLEVRLADLKKKGFQPQVRPRHKIQKRYWIDVLRGVDSSILTRTQKRFSNRVPIVRKACDPKAVGNSATELNRGRPREAEREALRPSNVPDELSESRSEISD